MIKLLTLLLFLVPAKAQAARAVMEGIAANNTTIMVATTTGRVGIGLTSPSHVLHVGGNIQSSGTIYSIGGLASTGTIRGAGSLLVAGSLSSSGTVSATSYYFGDGTNQTTAAGAGTGSLTSTQTWSGANTFVSSLTVQSGGRAIIISTSASQNNIYISSGGAVSFSPKIHISSVTTDIQGSTAGTTFTTCYGTATITTEGGDVAVWFTGALQNSNAGQGCIVSLLQDSRYIAGKTNAIGHAVAVSHANNIPDMASFYTLIKNVPAGTHAWCLTMAALANTCDFTFSSYHDNEFGAVELR